MVCKALQVHDVAMALPDWDDGWAAVVMEERSDGIAQLVDFGEVAYDCSANIHRLPPLRLTSECDSPTSFHP
jgi:hypothetical protein